MPRVTLEISDEMAGKLITAKETFLSCWQSTKGDDGYDSEDPQSEHVKIVKIQPKEM